MVRLILLTAPIASILGGIAAGKLFAWCIRQFWESHEKKSSSATSSKKNESNSFTKRGKNKKGKKNSQSNLNAGPDDFTSLKASWEIALSSSEGVLVKRSLAALVIFMGFVFQVNFINYCWRLSGDLSSPTIIVKARLRDGRVIKVDDYRDAYTWLKKNTPEDARIMAWWDYGYQISGIANRTTLADGNTWNHEHIALLGKALTASEEEGYEIARHLADYVLIWGGGGGDDLAKSPHLARIANSVYRDHCPAGDTTCRAFGLLNREGAPSPMMERSLLYQLHGNKVKPGVEADLEKWREVYRSMYGRVRIYKILGVSQESKDWVEENRKCDAEGSWFCPGTYPPGLQHILSRKKDFAQLEDFNSADADEEYQKRYFEALNDPAKAARNALMSERREMAKKRKEEKLTKEKADEIYNKWQDTEDTTLMWNLIAADKVTALQEWLDEEPAMAFLRSKDGRGPMWWAFEQRNEAITKLLMSLGVPHTDKDSKGLTPADLLEGKA